MGSMSAFEQQLARVASEVAGPTRSVDAVAVARSAKSAPVPRWSVHARWLRGGAATPAKGGFDMFAALKFVTASVIVALFGGFLLSGIPTSPPGDEIVPAAVTGSPAPASAAATVVMKPTVVTGEVECDAWPVCDAVLTDQRVSGTLFMYFHDEVVVPGAELQWGEASLPGPDGKWAGPFVATRLKGNTMEYLLTLEGTAGYEGWAFVARMSEPLADGAVEIIGAIYEGSARLMEWPAE